MILPFTPHSPMKSEYKHTHFELLPEDAPDDFWLITAYNPCFDARSAKVHRIGLSQSQCSGMLSL